MLPQPVRRICAYSKKIRVVCILAAAAFAAMFADADAADAQESAQKDLFSDVGSDKWMRYVEAQPEESFTRFRDGLAKASIPDAANALSYLFVACNPHWRELIDIGMNAADRRLQSAAEYALESVSFRKFPLMSAPYRPTLSYVGLLNDGGKAYAEWQSRTMGKTLEQAVTESESELIRTIGETTDASVRDGCLRALFLGDFRSGCPLAQLHRKVASERRILDVLEACVRKGPPSDTLFSAFVFFGADEALLRRVVLPYTGADAAPALRMAALNILLARRSPLAAAILTDMIVHPPKGMPRSELNYPVTICRDPKLIPIYLGALEAGEEGYLAKEMVIGLHYMTGYEGFTQVPRQTDFVGAPVTEWEHWWKINRSRFPENVRSIGIPRLPWRGTMKLGFPVRPAAMGWRDLASDKRIGYWQICPPTRREADAAQGRPAPPDLILLVAQDIDADESLASREALCRAAQEAGCILAIVQPPLNKIQTAPGAVALQNLLQNIRREIERAEGRTFQRVALVGMRLSCPGVLACGLAKQTDFQEFCVVDTPFRLNELPSLRAARSRHFLLWTTGAASGAPKWQTDLASSMLRRNGAHVTMDSLPADGKRPAVPQTHYFDAVASLLLRQWGDGSPPVKLASRPGDPPLVVVVAQRYR